MHLGEISDTEETFTSLFELEKTADFHGRTVKLANKIDYTAAFFVQTIADNANRQSSIKIMGSVGGKVSVDKEKNGEPEVRAEVHVQTTSEDGNTSAKASGSASVDKDGNCSGRIEVQFDHDF